MRSWTHSSSLAHRSRNYALKKLVTGKNFAVFLITSNRTRCQHQIYVGPRRRLCTTTTESANIDSRKKNVRRLRTTCRTRTKQACRVVSGQRSSPLFHDLRKFAHWTSRPDAAFGCWRNQCSPACLRSTSKANREPTCSTTWNTTRTQPTTLGKMFRNGSLVTG
jgi:hypothetical protein